MRAALFPGQGASAPGVPADTARQQPAVFERSIAGWRAAAVDCQWFAGHSLGTYAALVAAGALGAEDGARVVAARGAAMADASARRAGSMVALLGCDPATATELADRYGLTVANDNDPGQVVLSGELERVGRLEQDLRGQSRPAETATADSRSPAPAAPRAIRVRRLNVSGAFHSPLMEPAAAALARALSTAKFGDSGRVVANATARPYQDPCAELAAELVAPVRWRSMLEFLWAVGVREFIEFDPAGVLRGMVRRTLPDAVAITIDEFAGAPA